MKKKIALLLALIIIIALTIPMIVLAEDTEPAIPENTGSIELSTLPDNSFDGMVINAYQIFSVTGNETIGWSYVIHPDFADFNYNELSSFGLIEYIYSLEDEALAHGPQIRSLTEALLAYIIDNNIVRKGFVAPPEKENIMSMWLPEEGEVHACPNITSVMISDLPLGYYLISGQVLVTEGQMMGWNNAWRLATPFIALASTNNPEHPLIVSPKVSFPNFLVSRLISSDSYAQYLGVGDILHGHIETSIPLNVDMFDNYIFNVHLLMKRPEFFESPSKLFDIDPDSIEIQIMGVGIVPKNDNNYILHGEGIKLFNCTSDNVQLPNPLSPDLTIEFNNDFLKKNKGKTLFIRYSGTINDKLGTNAGDRIWQHFNRHGFQSMAFLEFSDNPLDATSYQTIRGTLNFQLISINVYKYTGDIESLHQPIGGDTGVKFALSRSGNAQTGTYIDEEDLLIFEINSRTTLCDRAWFENYEMVYIEQEFYVLSLDQESPLSKSRVKQLIPNDKGILTIWGLPLGVYYLYETVAPDNYNQLSAPQQISIEEDEFHNGFGYIYDLKITPSVTIQKNNIFGFPMDWNIIAVQNNRSSMFPETGGIGTGIFLLIGSIIMIISGIALIIIRKKSKEKDDI